MRKLIWAMAQSLTVLLMPIQAMAYQPPYQVTSLMATGTASIESFGGCNFPLKKYYNVQYGSIKDSRNETFGGFLTADGHLIASDSDDMVWKAAFDVSIYNNDSPPTIVKQRTRESFVGITMMTFIESEAKAASGCGGLRAWPTTNSYLEIKQNQVLWAQDIIAKQGFVGIASESVKCKKNGRSTTCSGGNFRGKFTFSAHNWWHL